MGGHNLSNESIDFKGMSKNDSLIALSILTIKQLKPKPIHSDTSYFGKKYELFADTTHHDDSSVSIITYLNDFEYLVESRGRNSGKDFYYYSEINNKRNGVFKNFYPNGNLRSIQLYVFDIEVGDWLEYYPNGKLKSIKVFDFEYSDFFLPPQEMVRERVDHSYGICCDSTEYLGPVKMPIRAEYFYSNGFIERIEFYKDRKKTGVWKYFSQTGNLKKEEEYEFGILKRTVQF